jgi:thioesterase III
MAWLRHTYEFIVQETHLDSFGHMNNATYLELFEQARWDFITSRGYGYKEVHDKQVGPTILEINMKFKREVRLRQKIRIESQVISYDGKVGILLQEMRSESGELLTEMKMTMALFDLKARRLIVPTEEWLRAVGWSAE